MTTFTRIVAKILIPYDIFLGQLRQTEQNY